MELFGPSAYAADPNVLVYCSTTPLHPPFQFVSQEKTRCSAGQPDTAAFLDPPALIHFCKCVDLVNMLEQEFKSIRSKFLPIFDRSLAPQQSRLEVAFLADLLIRSAFSRSLPANLKIKGATGKFNSDKIIIIKRAWAKIIEGKYPDLGFSSEADLVDPELEKTPEDKLLMEKVEPTHLGEEPPAQVQDPQADRSEVYAFPSSSFCSSYSTHTRTHLLDEGPASLQNSHVVLNLISVHCDAL